MAKKNYIQFKATHQQLIWQRLIPTLLSILLCCVSCFSPVSLADANRSVDSQNKQEVNRIKSAYLYNFLKYIDFKVDQQQLAPNVFNVCVYGEDPFEEALDSLVGRKAKGLEVKIKRTNIKNELVDCHIVYISQSEKNQLSVLLDTLKDYSILTVSEIKNFTSNGGIIGFSNRDNKIAIEINLKNAKRADIQISAMLLEIATVIE